MANLLIFGLFIFIAQFIFFSVGLLMYPRYKFSLWKVLLVSLTPLGAILAIISGIRTSMTGAEYKDKFTNWLFELKDKYKK